MENKITALEVIQDLSLMRWRERNKLLKKKQSLWANEKTTVAELIKIQARIDELSEINSALLEYCEKLGFSEAQWWQKIAEEREKLEDLVHGI